MGGDVWSPQEIAPTSQAKCHATPAPFSQTMKLKYMLKWNNNLDKSCKVNETVHIWVTLPLVIFMKQGRSKNRMNQNIFAMWVTEQCNCDFSGWVCVCVQVCLCGGDLEALQQGPRGSVLPSPAHDEAVFLDRGPGPSPRHAALLQPLQSADSHWHYISWGDIVDRVCECVYSSVDAPF